MSGGARYWNEETQRWEDSAAAQSGAPVTPPPPAMPDRAPEWPPAAPPTAAEGASAPAVPPAPEPVPPVPPAPWPDSADGWHGPQAGAADGTTGGLDAGQVGGAGWSAPEWPVPSDAPPAPAGGLSRRTVWTVVVGAAVVGVAVSLVLTLVVGTGHHRPARAGGSPSPSLLSGSPAPTGDTSGSPGPTDDTASPSASASPLPAGWESYDDEEGFRIARPKGWSRSTVSSSYGIDVVNYRSPDKEHRLQVYQVAEASPDESFNLYLSDQTPKPPGFRKLALTDLGQAEVTGARLEYQAGSIKGEPDVGTWHVYDERFTAVDGRIYAIAAYGPERDGRGDELKLLDTALSRFCPPYTSCDAPMD
jgi:hypothetical protein